METTGSKNEKFDARAAAPAPLVCRDTAMSHSLFALCCHPK